jgi:hypothetical protein
LISSYKSNNYINLKPILMRKLASVQKILSLTPIEGADKIEMATVLGWELVVKKGEFNVGDMVVYCEVDSILPEREEFEFLRDRKFRIKTIRLRGQISQGICFPLNILPNKKYSEDQDVTELLGVIKYEPYQEPFRPSGGKVKNKYIFPNWMPKFVRWFVRKYFEKYCYNHYRVGNTFPPFIPKTDETRVQVLQKLLDQYAGVKCYITEKVDGSSVTYYLNKGKFGVCSRKIDLSHDTENHFWKYAIDNNIENKMRLEFGNRNVAIQGELLGNGIQGNKYGLTLECRFFNVFDIDKQRYFDFVEFFHSIARMQIAWVPILNSEFILTNSIPALVEMAKIKSTIKQDIWAEGIVIRPLEEIVDKSHISGLVRNRVSFKAINPEFQLKYGE